MEIKNVLKENGLSLKEADLVVKFECVTKTIFTRVGMVVDEDPRKELNTAKNKLDIIVNLGHGGLIVTEGESVKESGYNKFSSVSGQLGAFKKLAEGNGH